MPTDWRIAVALVGVQLLVRGWVVTGSYYFQDDFAHLEMARRAGWSGDYLVRDYGGHLEIGQYALIWLLSRVVEDSFLPAALLVLLLQGIASLLLFALLRAVFGESPLIVVALSVYLFTPLALAWTAWFAAAVQTLPLQISMLVTLWSMTRLHQTGRRRWALLAVLAHAAGLLFWQKALLVLPAALAFQLLVVADGGLRGRVAALGRHRRVWLVHLVLVGAYLGLYTCVVDGLGEQGATTVTELRALLGTSLLKVFVPGLFGGPWHADGAEETLYPMSETYLTALFLGAFLTLVVVSFRVTGKRAALAWLLLAGYLSADLALMVLGRADWLGLLARDPRYVADALPIVSLALAAAFRGALDPGPERSALAVTIRERVDMSVALRAVLVLGVSSIVTTLQLAPLMQHQYPRNYVRALTSQLDEEVRLVDSRAPEEIAARLTVAELLRAVGREDVVFDRPGTELSLVDGLGGLRRVALLPGSGETSGPLPGCGWRLGAVPTDVTTVELESRQLLRADFVSAGPARLAVGLGDAVQHLDVDGVGSAYFVLPAESGAVRLTAEPSDAVCVATVAVGPAWVAEP